MQRRSVQRATPANDLSFRELLALGEQGDESDGILGRHGAETGLRRRRAGSVAALASRLPSRLVLAGGRLEFGLADGDLGMWGGADKHMWGHGWG